MAEHTSVFTDAAAHSEPVFFVLSAVHTFSYPFTQRGIGGPNAMKHETEVAAANQRATVCTEVAITQHRHLPSFSTWPTANAHYMDDQAI